MAYRERNEAMNAFRFRREESAAEAYQENLDSEDYGSD